MARSRNGFVTLKEQHVSLLKRSNYLLRSALNSFSFFSEWCFFDVIWLANLTPCFTLSIFCLSKVWRDQQLMMHNCYGKFVQNTTCLSTHSMRVCLRHCLLLCISTVAAIKQLRLDHLVLDQCQRLNPLQLSTYDDEDFVGKIKRLCMLSHPSQMGFQVLERYSAFVCCRWLRRQTEWYIM